MATIPVKADLDFTGGARVLGLTDAATAQEPATLAQLQAAVEGIAWKDSARVASTANLTVAGPGATIDAISMSSGDRVLAKNQTSQPENGLYIWNGAAVPMTRALDASTFAELEGAVVTVEEGTAGAGTVWRQTQVNGTLGTNNVIWTAFGTSAPSASETTAGISEVATQAETDAGSVDNVFVTPLKLATSPFAAKRYAVSFGDGSATSYVITHNLNSLDVNVYVYETGGSKRRVECEVQHTGVNSVTILTAAAVASNALRAVVKL